MLEKLLDAISDFIKTRKNWLGLALIVGILLPIGLRAMICVMVYAAGWDFPNIFSLKSDRFADLLKAAMSYKGVMKDLIDQPRSFAWSQLYKNYLVINPTYMGYPLTHYNMPPFGALLHIVCAEIIYYCDPNMALLAFIAFYLSLGLTVTDIMKKAFHTSSMDGWAVMAAFACSYSVLFMLFRGNILAGFTTTFLCFYAMSALSGRFRRIGWLCLALAINLRPNTAVFLLIEGAVRERQLLKAPLVVALASTAVALSSLAIVQIFDPDFTLHNMRYGWEMYYWAYIQGDLGQAWNMSLLGALRVILHWCDLQDYSVDTLFFLIQTVGAIVGIMTLLAVYFRKLGFAETTFAAAAASMLFTPVFAFYHMTEFIVPLVVMMCIKGARMGLAKSSWVMCILCLLCLCPIGTETSVFPFVVFAYLLFKVWQALNRDEIVELA